MTYCLTSPSPNDVDRELDTYKRPVHGVAPRRSCGAGMTLQLYVQEDGTGPFKNFRVPDLIPPNGAQVNLLLVLESPHRDELRTGLPLSGDAGQRALAFLSPTGDPPEALGPYVAARHAIGDVRIGIMNVSPVPLQVGAFVRHRKPPALSQADWDLLEVVRSHRASTIVGLPSAAGVNLNKMLLPGLSTRLADVTLSSKAQIFIAGNFVHRTWDSLGYAPKVAVLPIPHPSKGWWTTTKRQKYIDNLGALRTRFSHLESRAPGAPWP